MQDARRLRSAPLKNDFTYFLGPDGRSFIEPLSSPQGKPSASHQDSASSESGEGDSILLVSEAQNQSAYAGTFNEQQNTAHDQGQETAQRQQYQYRFRDSARFRASALCQAAALAAQTPGISASLLLWQAEGVNDATRAKSFRDEVLSSDKLLVFAYMRPGSAFVQLLHSLNVFSAENGEEEIQGQVFGFLGDRTTGIIRPIPASIPDKVWKWLARKVVLDTTPLEQFYSVPANAKKLYQPTSRTGEQSVVFPRFILLPPELIEFCAEEWRTPFALHQKTVEIANAATDDGNITIENSHLLRDWCIAASHDDATSAANSSIMSIPFNPAPWYDNVFAQWAEACLDKHLKLGDPASSPRTGESPSDPAMLTPPPNRNARGSQQQPPPFFPSGYPPHPLHNTTVPPVAAPPDLWAQIAASLSQGIASVAASLHPQQPATSSLDPATLYDQGGRDYDEFQVAILRGFSHSYNISDIPPVWQLFQYTKQVDTHRDNVKRHMKTWANNAKPDQVMIDRGLYFTTQTMKDILALRFNPGGPMAEVATAGQGLSILTCRPLTAEGKAILRQKELLEATSKRKTFAEAEQEITTSAPMAFPDTMNELHVCIGTYCALLHTLFGERCAFYKHCYKIWTTMNSETVYDQRHLFSPTFCRQILWAIIEYGRAYFAQRMSVDDFIGVHPDDICYPRSNLLELEPLVRTLSPIVRSSFPAAWCITGTAASVSHSAAPGGPPMVVGGGGGGTVVSAVTGASTPTRRHGQAQTQRPQIAIRATNVHPHIKAAMEPYIRKIQGIKLTHMLNHVNLTIDDLPQLPPSVAVTNGVCYNYILGHCTNATCPRLDSHVNVSDISDEFATELITKLRPAITAFMTNGAPKRMKRKRRT